MHSSEQGTVHIVGAGLAGLSAAVRLAGSGRAVALHEAASQAGGRCRSYFDSATEMTIDNGTHLVLSGNRAVLSFAETIGSRSGLAGPDEAEFPFVDLAFGERWTLRFGESRFPWWVFDKERRVPRTAVIDYLPLARLMWSKDDRRVGETIDCRGPIYDRLIEPLLLAALNIAPRDGSTKLAGALVRETLALGGHACRPLLAREGLGRVFVDPALDYLRARNVAMAFGDELIALHLFGGRVVQLEFTERRVDLGEDDTVILAVPPYVAAKLVPDLHGPNEFRGIMNAHFRIEPPDSLPPMLGTINSLAQWIFPMPGRISVTISDAGQLFDLPRAELAERLWRDVAKATGLTTAIPPWQIVRERRATFAATPEQNALRPTAETAWRNLLLAGDWTATGLPATLESAVRSGYRAADLASQKLRAAA